MIRDIFDPKVTDEKAKAALPVFSVRFGHDGPCNVHAATQDRAERVFKEAYGIRSTDHEPEVYEGPTKAPPVQARLTNPKTGKPFDGPVGPVEREMLRKAAEKKSEE